MGKNSKDPSDSRRKLSSTIYLNKLIYSRIQFFYLLCSFHTTLVSSHQPVHSTPLPYQPPSASRELPSRARLLHTAPLSLARPGRVPSALAPSHSSWPRPRRGQKAWISASRSPGPPTCSSRRPHPRESVCGVNVVQPLVCW
jgi:hypothetical protein